MATRIYVKGKTKLPAGKTTAANSKKTGQPSNKNSLTPAFSKKAAKASRPKTKNSPQANSAQKTKERLQKLKGSHQPQAKIKIPLTPEAPLKIPQESSSSCKAEFFDRRINLSHPNFEQFMFHFQEIARIFEKNPEVEKNSLAKAALSALNFESATSLTMRSDGGGNQTLITKLGKKEAQLAQGKDFTSMHITDGKSATHILRRGGRTEVIHFP
ncbi:hypothetical protein COU37_05865 [Candidatus Micrarchaeota archaeon CG10_big_fil_rev_8_21_14_0_10_45_29]|nr:MAG: hypothetical protein COU37_05865 [Candidatus Micrarchaeota archaeon CG10_big_fil_rev_8_21_14_0_10_45_29]